MVDRADDRDEACDRPRDGRQVVEEVADDKRQALAGDEGKYGHQRYDKDHPPQLRRRAGDAGTLGLGSRLEILKMLLDFSL